jgi:hypothetical protein
MPGAATHARYAITSEGNLREGVERLSAWQTGRRSASR